MPKAPNLVPPTSLVSSLIPTIIMVPPSPLSSVTGVFFQPTMTTATSSALNDVSASSPQSQAGATSTRENESGSTKLVPFFVLLPLAVITGVLLLVCTYSFLYALYPLGFDNSIKPWSQEEHRLICGGGLSSGLQKEKSPSSSLSFPSERRPFREKILYPSPLICHFVNRHFHPYSIPFLPSLFLPFHLYLSHNHPHNTQKQNQNHLYQTHQEKPQSLTPRPLRTGVRRRKLDT